MYFPKIKYTPLKRLKQLERNHSSDRYQKWRDTVLERDGHECQYPNCGKRGKLQVHHIKKFSKYRYLRFETRNGISLCPDHHRHVTGREEAFAGLFMDIANKNEKHFNSNDSA